ncbi:CU044_2847 family protein [Leptolyngbya ohadii]|uniref:CU044_2847 family protein n=1 Tax=Leptolyngbya ohadii TaxID=1962290 RepID=UPI0015C6233A|nr:CU044_2847 family protein [Leptolyngbya ohadii]
MAQLVPIQLSDGTMIYIEAIEAGIVSDESAQEESEEVTRGGGKGMSRQIFGSPSLTPDERFKAIQTTVRTYTAYTLNAFRNLAVGEVQKVSLEFGVNMSGASGIPYIASGTVGCNLKITVECAFPDRPAGGTPRPGQPSLPNPNPPLPPSGTANL